MVAVTLYTRSEADCIVEPTLPMRRFLLRKWSAMPEGSWACTYQISDNKFQHRCPGPELTQYLYTQGLCLTLGNSSDRSPRLGSTTTTFGFPLLANTYAQGYTLAYKVLQLVLFAFLLTLPALWLGVVSAGFPSFFARSVSGLFKI